MSDLEVVRVLNGQFAQNCYLIADRRSGEAAILDPGEEPARFLAEAAARHWTIRGIWLTHAHIDHVLGLGVVKRATEAPIHVHPLDRPLYNAVPNQAAWSGTAL